MTALQRLAEVRQLAAKATGGDWFDRVTDVRARIGTDEYMVARLCATVGKTEYEQDNARYIAALHNFIRDHGEAIEAAITRAEAGEAEGGPYAETKDSLVDVLLRAGFVRCDIAAWSAAWSAAWKAERDDLFAALAKATP